MCVFEELFLKQATLLAAAQEKVAVVVSKLCENFFCNTWGFCTFYLLTTENGVSLPLQLLLFSFWVLSRFRNHVTGLANEIICLQKVFSSLLRLSIIHFPIKGQ